MQHPSCGEAAGKVVEDGDDPWRQCRKQEAATLHECGERSGFGGGWKVLERYDHRQRETAAEPGAQNGDPQERRDLRPQDQREKSGNLHGERQP